MSLTCCRPSDTDVAQFLTGVAADQIWFQKVGNNLETSIIGASDKLVIQNWYLGNEYHVEQFKTTDDAKTLTDSNVQNLVPLRTGCSGWVLARRRDILGWDLGPMSAGNREADRQRTA